MIQNFNIFNQKENPIITLCNIDTKILFVIDKIIYQTNISLKYNAISTFSFKVPKFINGEEVEAYSFFEAKRLVWIENIGYFIITKTEEEIESLTPVFNIECQSIEAELLNKKISNIEISNATIYELFTQKIFPNYIPNWSFTKDSEGNIIDIPQDLKYLSRTFKISDKNIYSFLNTDVQSAYGCVIIFNRFDRTLYIKSAEFSHNNEIDVLLSYDNLVKQSEFSEYSDEIATSLRCYGGNGLGISRANPLGTNMIYDFSYYRNSEWMSGTLRSALDNWDEAMLAEEENADDSNLIFVKNNNDVYDINSLYGISAYTSDIERAFTEREKEIERIKLVLGTVQGDTEEANLKKGYYATNIDFLKNSTSLSAPTKTVINEYCSAGITIPSEFLLDISLLYKWSYYKGLNSIISSGAERQTRTEIIKNKIYTNKSKYSSKISFISSSYETLDVYSKNRAEMEYLYTRYESLLTSNTGESDKNKKMRQDYKTLMSFIKSAFPYDRFPTNSVPGYKYYLNFRENEIPDSVLIAIDFQKTGGIEKLDVLITREQSFIRNLLSVLSRINSNLNLNNFLGDSYNELVPFIIENSYQNENITFNDDTSEGELYEKSKVLLEQSKLILNKIKQPRYEFSIESANFINLPEYKDTFTKNLELGKVATISIKEELVYAILLEIKYSLEEPNKLNLVFSNRLRLDNGSFQYTDVLGKFININQDVSFNDLNWSDWSSYRNEVSVFIDSAFDTSKNQIYTTTDEEISIGDYGIRAKKKVAENQYSDEQLWITNNSIAFTDDNWSSSKLALGKVKLPNGSDSFGIAGESIIGKIIAGNELTISNKVTSSGEIDTSYSNLFKVSKNEVIMWSNSLENKGVIMSSNGGKSGIILNPLDGIRIGQINGDSIANPSVFIDSFGKMVLTDGKAVFSKLTETLGEWVFGKLTSEPNAEKGLYYRNYNSTIENFIYTDINPNFASTDKEKLVLKLANGGFTMTNDGTVKIGLVNDATLIMDAVGKTTLYQILDATEETLFEVFDVKSKTITVNRLEIDTSNNYVPVSDVVTFGYFNGINKSYTITFTEGIVTDIQLN